MKYVLFICPTSGNGGIQSWTRKMLTTFSNDEFELYHLNVSHRRSESKNDSRIRRVLDGVLDMISVCRRTIAALKKQKFDLMHTTTSGNIGTLRDFFLVKICHRYHVKCIMHCRYGCITEDFNSKGFWGKLLRKTMYLYDNVWVLDKRSESALNKDEKMQGKVFLTPNSINVPAECDLSSKKYKKLVFVGNLIPSKGLYELIHAVSDYDLDVSLTIAGPENPVVIEEMKRISGNKWGRSVNYVGKLKNDDAVKLIKSVDIVVLASYYPSEAFPISILEAMSYGKLVIATKRAAIPDMLTDVDGNECGYFVREQSVEDIVKAIKWSQAHISEADCRCAKAYEKVRDCYSTEVIYNLYRKLYKNLLNK